LKIGHTPLMHPTRQLLCTKGLVTPFVNECSQRGLIHPHQIDTRIGQGIDWLSITHFRQNALINKSPN
jgi:hypothetical protein